MTYSQLHTSVVRVASALVKLGLRKGDVVAIYSPNCLQFVIATLAIVAAGAAFSSVNPSYTAGDETPLLKLKRCSSFLSKLKFKWFNKPSCSVPIYSVNPVAPQGRKSGFCYRHQSP